MTEFYLGQSVYIHSPADTWVRGTVQQLDADRLVEIVEVEIQHSIGLSRSMVYLCTRPGDLVKGDAG